MAFIMLLSIKSFSQSATIMGVIKDAQTNKPIELVEVFSDGFFVQTDAKGKFSIELPAKKQTLIYFYLLNYQKDSLVFDLQSNTVVKVEVQLRKEKVLLEEVNVVEEKSRLENTTKIDIKSVEYMAGPNAGVEGILMTMPGVSSRNEMSSQYSVRGGNFDENLVYVNGIEIYRPFLVRNGQQEGLSFINPDMVGSIDFSAGGFDARYGDKMSSVLDITYKKPEKFGLKAEASFLGASLTGEGVGLNNRFTAQVSVRYRQNQLLLGSMDTEADFRPQFTDIQAFLTYAVNDQLEISYLGNFSRNVYRVVPEIRQTDFGTVQQAQRLTVFFEGQENYDFVTRFSALSATYKPSKKLFLDLSTSVFQTVEQEYFDVAGAYRLGDLDNNLGSDNFGEVNFVRGVGGFQNYARNLLDGIVFNINHRGSYVTSKSTWGWGVKWQVEDIQDRYKEWEYIDSAGYTVPHRHIFRFTGTDSNRVRVDTVPPSGVFLFESFDSRAEIFSQRIMAYVENTRKFKTKKGDFSLTAGVRAHYWSLNQQTIVTPRATLKFQPEKNKASIYRLSAGMYHQPAFYREMRDLSGEVNTNLRAQESYHVVLGNDRVVTLWKRPFRIVNELYFKHMNNLVLYELENVRLRYTAQNNASGFATGYDFRINGEFVKGIESWFSFSAMTVRERLFAQPELGYLPRPTDQLINASIYFQDYLPSDPTWRMGLTLSFGTGQPFLPPQSARTDNVFRISPYRRVDISIFKLLKEEGKQSKIKAFNNLRAAWIGVEVFNLFAIRNTISYLWIKDINSANPDLSSTRQFAVPNYLTARLINLKFVVKI